MLARRNQRGDTIIEVLFAVSVFSFVAIGGLTLMNQGSNTSQRALEITLVRQQIDAQAEALRFLHNSYVAAFQANQTSYPANTPAGQWAAMLTSIKATNLSAASNFGGYTTCPGSTPNGSFVINTRTAQFVDPAQTSVRYKDAPVYSRLTYTDDAIDQVHGLWIEAVRSGTSGDVNQADVGFIDFHIRACWSSVGLSVPMTLGTIVRLYEPRG